MCGGESKGVRDVQLLSAVKCSAVARERKGRRRRSVKWKEVWASDGTMERWNDGRLSSSSSSSHTKVVLKQCVSNEAEED